LQILAKKKKKQTLVATCKPQNNKIEPVFKFFFFTMVSVEVLIHTPKGMDKYTKQKLTGFEKRTDQKKEEDEIGGQKKALLSLSCHLGSD
jgi:hypothetical protein